MREISWVSEKCLMLPVALGDTRLKATSHVTGEACYFRHAGLLLLQEDTMSMSPTCCTWRPSLHGHAFEQLLSRFASVWSQSPHVCPNIACHYVRVCPHNECLLSVNNSLRTTLFLRSTVLQSFLLVSWQ